MKAATIARFGGGKSWEGFPSGQREQTVNLSALPSKVRILPPPPILICGCSSMVEQKPSKLMTRVRFPSPAPGSAAFGRVPRVITRSAQLIELQDRAHVAQWQSTP